MVLLLPVAIAYLVDVITASLYLLFSHQSDSDPIDTASQRVSNKTKIAETDWALLNMNLEFMHTIASVEIGLIKPFAPVNTIKNFAIALCNTNILLIRQNQ